ncbi:hypothetical protein HGP28_12840 [Vibrio sp. SM6]|uniref:Prepilin type IV endopeptidase peptidase domain-containing protein n=1 Tax=Vibrio agarilyticus TaxID=2726741 RepID=A0A7X8YH66_9VIBR|nr:prepilin peptidase [Vibrio agarilyticus]NLS13778.1 hypothetical protein [Vibrio agarilyticus]
MLIYYGWLSCIAIITIYLLFTDIIERKISNGAVVLLFIICFSFKKDIMNVYWLAPLVIVFFGLFLSYFGVLGGGDTKLFAAYSIAIDPALMPTILVIIGLCGGVLSVIYWLLNKYHLTKQPGIPYAIPIVIGGVIGVLASN